MFLKFPALKSKDRLIFQSANEYSSINILVVFFIKLVGLFRSELSAGSKFQCPYSTSQETS